MQFMNKYKTGVCVFFFMGFFVFFPLLASEKGRNLFTQQCNSCHTIGMGRLIGPDLKGIREKHSEKWLIEFVRSAKRMVEKKDSHALALVAEYGVIMPNSHLSDEEIREIFQYIEEEERILFEKKAAKKKLHVKEKWQQPIDFSHKLHAGDYRVPCLYCHFGAAKSRHAGIPPVNVCLNCHSQIKVTSPEVQKLHQAMAEKKPLTWFKRHDLPDHVYFNHSFHVGAGLKCQTCHGKIQTMEKPTPIQITMGWCIKCHRESEKLGEKRLENVGLPHHRDLTTKLDCARCHH